MAVPFHVDELNRALKAIVGGSSADARESGTLDFKEEGRSPDDLLKEVAQEAVCFAHGERGTVVIGVRNKPGGLGALKGTTLPVEHVARIPQIPGIAARGRPVRPDAPLLRGQSASRARHRSIDRVPRLPPGFPLAVTPGAG